MCHARVNISFFFEAGSIFFLWAKWDSCKFCKIKLLLHFFISFRNKKKKNKVKFTFRNTSLFRWMCYTTAIFAYHSHLFSLSRIERQFCFLSSNGVVPNFQSHVEIMCNEVLRKHAANYPGRIFIKWWWKAAEWNTRSEKNNSQAGRRVWFYARGGANARRRLVYLRRFNPRGAKTCNAV